MVKVDGCDGDMWGESTVVMARARERGVEHVEKAKAFSWGGVAKIKATLLVND